ncbi:nuclear pore complex protein nup205-like [Plakobranchus ocellatus]|uniref:Nuclear pore complex protein nup205-like n=1 Tax=Plakobranchus ocellatus TaxID=259542 RepID=A0AAV3Z7R8_9GAST|nr:nuclear pore complex protein nup205-like [Plakobranchus ocellatus]
MTYQIGDLYRKDPLKLELAQEYWSHLSIFIMTYQIGDLYRKDPLKLELALEYWSPPESMTSPVEIHPNSRPDPKQISLFKFVRVSGDLLAAPLFLPYIHMLTGLASGPHAAYHCFSLLRVNGILLEATAWTGHRLHPPNAFEDPLKLELAQEYWSPPESMTSPVEIHPNSRPDPKQISLFKFVRVSGDLLAAPLFLPYIHMLTGLASGPHAAYHCFSLLRVNGGQASPVSWDHIFSSMHQYFSSLRQEAYGSGDNLGSGMYRTSTARSMTPQELEAVCACLRLTRHIADQSETCRSAFCENQQWSVVMVLFGLLSCSVQHSMKGEILCTLASIAQTPVFAATIWQTLESSQILPTIPSSGDSKTGQTNSIKVELEEVESRNEEFPLTRGFLQLISALTQFPVPLGLGAGTRTPGFDPYLDFILNSVLLKYNTRAYKDAAEKWQVVSACLEILVMLLTDYQLNTDDLRVDPGEMRGVGGVSASSHPGFAVLCLMLTDSQLFKTIQQILEEAVRLFEHFTPFPGREHMEQASLLCLRLLEECGDRQASLEQRIRETASPLMVSSLEKLLLAINPRTRKADYLTNITKFVVFNSFLPKHTSAAVRILYQVCQEAASQSDIVNLFTAEKSVSAELLQGFVECLDSNCPEIKEERASVLLMENEGVTDPKEPPVENVICEHIIQLLLLSLDQAAPNLAHWLMGFHLQKPVVRTTLQDPGVMGSPKTCLHSVLAMLERGLGSREGPASLMDRPQLAELGYRLVYALAANRDTSAPTLRYLRTTHDFLFRQLQHLPLDSAKYLTDVADHQSWLLRTAAIELRTTCLNRQRSHTLRLVKLLLGEDDQEVQSGGQMLDDGETTFADREATLSVTQLNVRTAGKQMRNRLLGVLDTISFEQPFPPPVSFTFFDRDQVEALVRSLEQRTREGVAYCDVRALRKVLLTELANQQGPMVAGQRPHIMEEIQQILETVVEHNECRELLQRKRRALEGWRQILGVLLTSVPQDLLAGERRQALLFDLLHELLVKVSGDEVNLEATGLVSDVLLTLMANLRHCFQSPAAPAGGAVFGGGDVSTLQPFSGGGSRTVFASSLQIVLKGLIDYILKSGGMIQKVRVNLYGALLYCLQIAKKPELDEDLLTGPSGKPRGMERLLYQDDGEYERLAAENMETISAYGDPFMEAVCRDACDGHHVGRMLALSVLDTVLSLDRQNAWLSFLCGHGYLQHLVDSVASEDDQQLLAVLAPQPANLRALYIFQSKMSLLTRVAQCPEGARTLLHSGSLEKLATCSVLSLRPEVDDHSHPSEDDDDDLVPSPLARYRQLLFAVLRFCLALLTSLGGENKEAATQVMLLVVSHSDVFSSILRNRKPLLNVSYLRELSLTTAVVARANYHSDLGADLLEQDTANMEFRSQRMRLQDQMLALLPHYSTPETVVKELNTHISSPTTPVGGRPSSSQLASDLAAQLLHLFQEVASNITAYCRSLITAVGEGSMNQHLLFGPSLEEVAAREGSRADELSVTLGVGRRLGVGVVLLLLQQSARQFAIVLDGHDQLSQKLASLPELTAEDLKQLCGDSAVEKLSSQQRQEVARGRLLHSLAQKSQQLQHYVYIVENCLYVIWRHLEFFLVHCVPADQSSMTTPTFMRHQVGMRKLTGMSESYLDSSIVGSPVVSTGLSQFALGVSRQDIEHLRTMAPLVLNETFFKKVQLVDERYGKERSHYSFTEAIVRRIKRVLRLHTGK